MKAFLRGLFGREQVLYECRHCGTDVGSATRCPVCTHDGIAVYEFE
jgi:rubrerythrin